MSLSQSRLHCCQWLALTFCFPSPSLYPSLSLPFPHALFSSLPFSPCPPLFLFCFHEQQRDARVQAGDILPLSSHLKRQLPLPTHSSTWIDNTHTHTHGDTGPLAEPTALHWPLNFLLQQCPCAHREAACPVPLLSHSHKHVHKNTRAHRTAKLAANPSFINSSLGGFLTDTGGEVPLTPWLTAATQIHLP